MTQSVDSGTNADDTQDDLRPWWRRIQWFDVLLVILGVMILLMLTFEIWMPHNPVGRE